MIVLDGLLLCVYDGLLILSVCNMGHTSMCQFHTGWSHFWRLIFTVDYDGVSTRIDDILND